MIAGLAPMAGYTDYAYRESCRNRGAQLTYTEMVSAEALVRGNPRTKKLLKAEKGEVTQLFGANPDSLKEASRLVKTGWADLNAGCPAHDVTNAGAGSALLKDLDALKECVRALKKNKSVKIRVGWKKNDAVKIAGACEDAGAQRIAVHGRTREQGYSGEADWAAIKEVVDAVSIPVLGNGDVKSLDDGVKRCEETGCAGFLVGRAAMGNPSFFCGKENRAGDFLEYAEKQEDFRRLKQQSLAFARGFPGAKGLRVKCVKADSRKELTGYWEKGFFGRRGISRF